MNGWIFPYRPWTGKTETVSTNLRLVVVPSFGLVSPRGVGTVAAVGQRRGDTEWEPAAEVVFRGQARSQSCRQIRMACMARCDDGSRYGSISGCPAVEKSLGVRAMAARTPNRHWWSGREYQAIERILVKELGKSLPCLGIRETHWGEGPCVRSFGGWHRPGGSDCLPKHRCMRRRKPLYMH